jgi:hypothetical protein
MIGAQDLSQENPQSNEWRKNPVQPVRAERCQRLADSFLRQNVTERQVSALKELTPENLNLLPNSSLVRMAHPGASLPLMDVVRNTI